MTSFQTLSAIALFLSLVFLSSCCSEIEVCYIEEIPYTAIEEWTEEAKYEVLEAKYSKEKICLETSFFGLSCDRYRWFIKSYAIVKNIDKESGRFSVSQIFETYRDGERKLTTPLRSLSPGESFNFILEYDLQDGNADFKKPIYSVNPPTLTKQKEVTKFRKETKYRKCDSCSESCKDKC
ncbi:hypothetical protein BH09BAC1_BH09BAC1_02300 [soil metagenome]